MRQLECTAAVVVVALTMIVWTPAVGAAGQVPQEHLNGSTMAFADLIFKSIQTLAIVCTTIAAIFSLNAWRRQIVGKRKIELAEQALMTRSAKHSEGNAVMAIKAIPIQYHGHLFRSRLEAKCAVVWQAHGLGNCMFGSNKFVPLFVVMMVVTVLGQTPGFAASSIGSVTLVHEYAYGTVEGGDKNGLFGHDDVYQKEIVETVIDGALHIEFVDETTLRLGSASSVALDTWVYDPNEKNGRMVISMVQGVFRFISGKIYKRGVRLLTPTIAIGIRGTDFTVAIATDGSTSVSVAEGEIEITPIAGGDTVSVTPGQIATVSTTSASVSISSGSTVSTDPGLSEAGSDGGEEGGDGGGGH